MSQTHERPSGGSTTSTPRWVKVFGIIIIVLVLLVVVVLVTGVGGEHGPGRHIPSDDASGHTAPIEQEVQQYGPDGHTAPIEQTAQQP